MRVCLFGRAFCTIFPSFFCIFFSFSTSVFAALLFKVIYLFSTDQGSIFYSTQSPPCSFTYHVIFSVTHYIPFLSAFKAHMLFLHVFLCLLHSEWILKSYILYYFIYDLLPTFIVSDTSYTCFFVTFVYDLFLFNICLSFCVI